MGLALLLVLSELSIHLLLSTQVHVLYTRLSSHQFMLGHHFLISDYSLLLKGVFSTFLHLTFLRFIINLYFLNVRPLHYVLLNPYHQ